MRAGGGGGAVGSNNHLGYNTGSLTARGGRPGVGGGGMMVGGGQGLAAGAGSKGDMLLDEGGNGNGIGGGPKQAFTSSPGFGEGGGSDMELQRTRMEALEADLTRRQESYIRRERAYKTRVEELENQLEDLKEARLSWMTSDKSMSELKTMHKRIINNVEIVQDRTAKILQEQEKDLLRAFRARLFDIQTELEKEKSRRDDGAGAWIDKSRKLEGELDWTTEVADRLDRMNQQLLKENSRLKTQFKLQDEDRSYLTKQLVSIKRDNNKLKQELDGLANACRAKDDEIDRLVSEIQAANGVARGGGVNNNTMNGVNGGGGGRERDLVGLALGAGTAGAIKGEADHRFKEIIRKLKRTLDLERRNLKAVRERLSEELMSRTELQSFLRQCIEDVRKQVAEVNTAATAPRNRNNSVSSSSLMKDFTPADREKTLSLLLSQDRVITLLYAKAFPVRGDRVGGGMDDLLVSSSSPSSAIMPTNAGSILMQSSASISSSFRIDASSIERPTSAPTGTGSGSGGGFLFLQKPGLQLNMMVGGGGGGLMRSGSSAGLS